MAIDYEALAKKHGGQSGAAAAPKPAAPAQDLASIAAKYGGQTVGEIPQRSWGQTLVEAGLNAPRSFVKLGKDIVTGFIEAPEQLAEFARNPEKLKAIADGARALGGAYAQMYGSEDAIKEKIATDPAGFLADLSTVVGVGGVVAPGRAGAVLTRVSRAVDPTRPYAYAAEKTIRGAGRTVARATDVATGKGLEVKAARIGRQAAGEALPTIIAGMRGTPSDGTQIAATDQLVLPRRELTAAEAAASAIDPTTGRPVQAPEFQALAARLQQRPGEPRFYGIGAETAEAERAAQLALITPDIEKATRARELATDPLYKKAFEKVIPVDRELQDLFSRMPKSVFADAAEIARGQGRTFTLGKNVSGESLHYIKRALADIVYAPPTRSKIGADLQRTYGEVLEKYLSLIHI